MSYLFVVVTCLLFVSMLCLCSLCFFRLFFFFKQKTAYEMRISDWSSDVCSSDLFQPMRTVKLRLAGDLVIVSQQETAIADCIQVLQRMRREIGRASCRERVCQYV